MDKNRIQRNINQLRAAKQIIELCFEDLKNVKAFRESDAGCLLHREKLIAMLYSVIVEAEACAGIRKE